MTGSTVHHLQLDIHVHVHVHVHVTLVDPTENIRQSQQHT